MKTLLLALTLTLSTTVNAAANPNEDCAGWLLDRVDMTDQKLGLEMVAMANAVDKIATRAMLKAFVRGSADAEKWGEGFSLSCILDGNSVGEAFYKALAPYRGWNS